LETAKNNPNNQKPPQKTPQTKNKTQHIPNNQKPTTTTKQKPHFSLYIPSPLNKHIKHTQPHNISSKQKTQTSNPQPNPTTVPPTATEAQTNRR
jgi:hypothetical protein